MTDEGERALRQGCLRQLAAMWQMFPHNLDYGAIWPEFLAATGPLWPRLSAEVSRASNVIRFVFSGYFGGCPLFLLSDHMHDGCTMHDWSQRSCIRPAQASSIEPLGSRFTMSPEDKLHFSPCAEDRQR